MTLSDPLNKDQKGEFVKLMLEGLSIRAGAVKIGVHWERIGRARRADPEFDLLVRSAMRSTAGIRQQATLTRIEAGHRATTMSKSGEFGGKKKIPRYVEPFLTALARGMSPSAAADFADISWRTVYKWKQEDPEFALRWAESIIQSNDLLEDEAHRRGVEGYNPRPVYDKEGNKVCEIRDYSDSLLLARLRGRIPEVYNRPDVSVSTKLEVRLTRAQALERMQQFGLPVPQLTAEFEDDADRITGDGLDRKQ